MTKNPTFKRVLFAIGLTAAVTGCGAPSDKKSETTHDSATLVTPIAKTTVGEPTANTEVFKEFDWNTVPQSSSEIESMQTV